MEFMLARVLEIMELDGKQILEEKDENEDQEEHGHFGDEHTEVLKSTSSP